MGEIEVADRGGREVVVFLRGDIDESVAAQTQDALRSVDTLERIDNLERVVVDMLAVTSIGAPGIDFLHALESHGRSAGYSVSFSTLSGPAHRAVEAAGWRLENPSPPV